jgi:serine/threonine-protein kinase
MADLTGQRLGQYLILERISKGATSTVYKAHQEKLERYVAVKVLSPHFIDEEGFLERFKQEARAVAQLDHPNILPVYDFDQVGDVVYIVMKYVDTGTLKDLMGTPMDPRVAVDICTQVGLALGYAHRQGVVHRDVKPGNILLGEGNWALLTDFGLAKIRAGDRKLTKSGIGMGTPDYMSPEQAQGLPVDGRADLYSLSCMLHEMLIGRVPFEADSGMAVVVKHITEPPRPPREFNPQLPLAVEQVILRALEKDSARRYQSAEAMVADLARAVGRADQLVFPDHLPTPATAARPVAARAAATVAETRPVAVVQARLTSTRVWLREKRPALVVAARRLGEWLAGQLRRTGRGLRRLVALFVAWIRRAFESVRASVSAQQAGRQEATGAGKSKRSRKATPTPTSGTLADRLRPAISSAGAGGGHRYLGVAGAAIALLVLLMLALRPAGDTSAQSTPTEVAVASPAKTQIAPTETASPTDAPPTPESTATLLPEAPPGMVAVTGGTFKMGATGGAFDADETPPHWVTVKPFYIDVVEVTVAQYARFAAGSGYVTDAEKKGDATTWRSANSPDRQRFPVNRVSWNDADIFCRWYGKRLPTEAEWELAAKGFSANIYSWGNTFSVDRANTFERGVGQPIAIATLANASPFGAYDMIGNVWEWVADWYGGNYYATSPADNPTGPASGLERVIRGGSFKSTSDRATTTIRRKASQDGWSDDVGFRCVKGIS